MTSKLGGQLEPFADVSKGYRLAKPLGWNRYDGTSGEYTVKMVDLVDPTTLILLTNSPVKSDTEVGFVLGLGLVKVAIGVQMNMKTCRHRKHVYLRLLPGVNAPKISIDHPRFIHKFTSPTGNHRRGGVLDANESEILYAKRVQQQQPNVGWVTLLGNLCTFLVLVNPSYTVFLGFRSSFAGTKRKQTVLRWCAPRLADRVFVACLLSPGCDGYYCLLVLPSLPSLAPVDLAGVCDPGRGEAQQGPKHGVG